LVKTIGAVRTAADARSDWPGASTSGLAVSVTALVFASCAKAGIARAQARTMEGNGFMRYFYAYGGNSSTKKLQ
jgi:hypothetical protein